MPRLRWGSAGVVSSPSRLRSSLVDHSRVAVGEPGVGRGSFASAGGVRLRWGCGDHGRRWQNEDHDDARPLEAATVAPVRRHPTGYGPGLISLGGQSMSRTRAHAPLHVRVARRELAAEAVHDHVAGICDLPAREHVTRSWRPVTRCHWRWVYDGTAVCSCELCRGGRQRRSERRADRHRATRRARAAARRWNGGAAIE